MVDGRRADDPKPDQADRLFSELDQVRREQAEQGATLKHVGDGFDRLSSAVEELRNYLATSSKTDWKTLASWATVILGIIGLGMALTISPIRQRQVEIHDELRRQHQTVIENRVDAARLQERARWLEKRRDHEDESAELRQIRQRLDKLIDDQREQDGA